MAKNKKPKGARKGPRIARPVQIYSVLDVQMASPTEPMPAQALQLWLAGPFAGVAAMEDGHAIGGADFRGLSDRLLMLRTLLEAGLCADGGGVMDGGNEAMSWAVEEADRGNGYRMSAPRAQAVRACLEDLRDVCSQIPHRTMLSLHRASVDVVKAYQDKKTFKDLQIKAVAL